MVFYCSCGERIVDQTDFLDYKAYYYKDIDSEDYMDQLVKKIESLMVATEDGNISEWITDNFSSKYPKDIDRTSLIYDLITSVQIQYENCVYQCTNCGNVYFEKNDSKVMESFKSESDVVYKLFGSNS